MSLVIYSAVLKEDLLCFKSTDNAKGSPFPQHFHTYVSLQFQKQNDFNRLFAHEVTSLCSCGVNCRCRASFASSTVAQIDRTKKPQEALIKYQKFVNKNNAACSWEKQSDNAQLTLRLAIRTSCNEFHNDPLI